MHSAIIYFGNELPLDAFRDAGRRREALRAGVELLRSVTGLKVKSELPNACAVVVEVSDQAVAKVNDLLASSTAGSMRVEDPARPAFRAAH